MSNLTVDSKPVYSTSSTGSENIDKTQDRSFASTAQSSHNQGNSKPTIDRFEQARQTFFSK